MTVGRYPDIEERVIIWRRTQEWAEKEKAELQELAGKIMDDLGEERLPLGDKVDAIRVSPRPSKSVDKAALERDGLLRKYQVRGPARKPYVQFKAVF